MTPNSDEPDTGQSEIRPTNTTGSGYRAGEWVQAQPLTWRPRRRLRDALSALFRPHHKERP